mgnify:CR=1 FL=1
MSFKTDNAAAQTAFRLAALRNGFVPLPNHDKRCFLKGWNTLNADEDTIKSWERKLVYQATGLRVEGGMCAIDIDIDDQDLVGRIWERAAAQYPQLREALIRYGSGAKEMWVCRTDEEFSVIFSTSHVKPGFDPESSDAPAYRLEAFGGGHPRQIGSSGAHTMKKDGSGFAVGYTWADDESPAEVRLDALPVLAKSAVLAIASIASEELAAAQWPRVRRSRTGESALAAVYDLTPTMRFDCLDGVTRNLEQLKDYATTSKDARCSASWTGDPQFVNRTRCLVSIDHTGTVSVLETANWTRHLPADEIDRTRTLYERTVDLRAKMEEVGFTLDPDAFPDAPASFTDVVFKLLDEWSWCGSRSSQCLPIYRDEELGMNLTNLRLTMCQFSYEREGPRGGVVSINPVDAWIKHSQRQDVDGYRFMPDRPPGIFATDDVRAINSYRAPVHERVEDDAEREGYVRLWEDFLHHLLPNDDEREWFMDWLAHKKQNLTTPGVGIIMYAREFGAGRGSLFEIIGSVFGDKYVNSVSADMLMGTSSQGQYTDWLADALFVTTDEVLPDGEEGTSMAWRRKKAFEKLKERIDPKPRRTDIIRKTLPNYQDWVYASFLLATNHDNAIPIPKGDRRLTVLTNTVVPLARKPDLMRRLNNERNPAMNPRFASCIASWLDARDVTGFNAHVAPEFSGKAKMQEANITELEGLIDDTLALIPYDWTTLDVVLARVDNALVRANIKDSYPAWRKVATDRTKALWHSSGRAYVTPQRTSKAMILTRTDEAAETFRVLSVDERCAEYADMSRLDSTASARLRALRAGMSEV